MPKTPAITTLAAAILGFFSAPCQAQHAVAVPLPIYPPTAAAAGMAHQHAQMLAAFDANHNGQLDPAEALAAQSGLAAPVSAQNGANGQATANYAAFQQFLMSKFDANGNGTLDLPEVEAAQLALGLAAMNGAAMSGAANQFGNAFGANQFGGNQFGANPFAGNRFGNNQGAAGGKNAKPGAGIKNVKRKNPLLVQFDKDGDGKLNAEEREAMEAAKTKPHAKGKPKAKQARAAKHAKQAAALPAKPK
ncbi:MAG TPA: hypothetical protein VHC19_06200 [Pirellulales bacterium]|jgi:hypothetical protein|nr:hypothetical protein [Pirellulales bacterium]